MASRKILVVAGVGSSGGTGGAISRVFAKNGFRIAMLARGQQRLQEVADEITAAGGEAVPFPVADYTYAEIHQAFKDIKKHWPSQEIRAAVWNQGSMVRKPFLEATEEDFKSSLQSNVIAPAAFAREAILAFQNQELDEVGARGALVFTSATAAWRGNKSMSIFSAGKQGLRGLAQSLNKEFGPENIHVAHAIIDGIIDTDRTKGYGGLSGPDAKLDPEDIASTYLYLVKQPRSAWTFELDLRPAHEKW